MNDNTMKKAVKTRATPSAGSHHQPGKAAKGKSVKSKVPPKKRKNQPTNLEEMLKPHLDESAAFAVSEPAKTETVADTKAGRATEKVKAKGKPNSSTGKSSKPKPVKPAQQSQPGHTSTTEPGADGAPATMPSKSTLHTKLVDNGPGVPVEASAAESDPEIDFGGFTPPVDMPGGLVNAQFDGQGHDLPLPGPSASDESPIRLTVTDEGEEQGVDVTAFDLSGAEVFDALREHCENSSASVIFKAHQLLDWPDNSRLRFLYLLRDIGPVARLQVDDGAVQADVFEAALGAMVDDADVDRCTNGLRLAHEAAALFRGDMIDVASSRIDKRLKALNVKGSRATSIAKEIRELVDALAQKPKSDKLVAVVTQVPGAPVAPTIMVPTAWSLTGQGIFRPGLIETPVASAPLLITTLWRDVNDGTESLGLTWKQDDHWVEQIVERHTAADSRSVVKLAAWGAPVNSNNAREVVQFIADFEAVNRPHLPRRRVARQMGWPGDGGFGSFVWGRVDLAVADPTTPDAAATSAGVTFKGEDAGEEQLVAGFHAGGTHEGWRDAVKAMEALIYPRVGLALYASLTPPLLSIVGAENFTVDFAGATSEGKSTTLRVAASAWGNPDEKSPKAALSTWDSSRVWIERASSILNSLPLILDDTQKARKGADVAQTLYDVTSGRGRGRGSVKGIAAVGTWTTVLISSGEAPITSFAENGGTRPRVLTIWGSPFGATDATTAGVVRAIGDGVKANYGHLGPRFVRFLIENRGSWPTWRTWYKGSLAKYTAQADGNAVAGRMADHFAVLELTASLVMEAFDDLYWVSEDQFDDLWQELTSEAPEADPVRRALRHAFDWATGHQVEFYGRHETHGGHDHHPSGGWAGRWDVSPQWSYLGFLPNRLKDVLAAGGFEFEPFIRNWNDRGWLLTNGGSITRYRAQVGGETTQLPWLIAVRREAIAGLDSGASS